MDIEWIVIGLLLMAVSAALARRLSLGNRLPKPGSITGSSGRDGREDARMVRARRIVEAATLIAEPSRARSDGAAMLEAGARLDPDIRGELEAVAARTEAMWQAFENRFGRRGVTTGHEQHQMADPVLVEATVRRLRAIDEQLRRLGLPPAPRPDDWVSRCAAGRVPLPPAPWDRGGGGPSDPFATLDPETLKEWQAEALQKAGGPQQRRLLQAVLRAAAEHPALAGIQTVPVPPLAGDHRNYHLAPVAERYIHLFPSEPLAEDVTADLVLVAGLRGHMFQYTAVRIDPDGRARAWRDGVKHAAVREALETAGYRVIPLSRREVETDIDACADRLCIAMAELFAAHRAA